MKIALVGAGVMGKNHARVLASLTGATFAGVVDVDAAAAAALARAHGVRAYASLEELAQDASVEAAVVATPTRTHYATALRLLEAGKHVLVEKPLAGNLAEAETLVAAAQKADRQLAVGHVERHNPVVAYAREALARGEFGDLIHLSARRFSSFPGRIRDVGAILDIGIHDIDVLRYLVGAPVSRVYAAGGTFTAGLGFEDHATLLLTFANGVTGSIEINWLTPMKVRTLSLTASRCHVELDHMAQAARISSSEFGPYSEANLFQVPLELHERRVQLKRQEPLMLELADFVASVAHGRAPLAAGQDGLAALRVAEAALESLHRGTAVPLQS